MTFRRLVQSSAVLCGLLCVALIVMPGAVTALFGLDTSVDAAVMARRAGVLFAPLALILWTVRDLPDGELRRNVATAGLVMMAGLALLGLGEWLMGRVGPGIFLAVATETVLAVLFARALGDRT